MKKNYIELNIEVLSFKEIDTLEASLNHELSFKDDTFEFNYPA